MKIFLLPGLGFDHRIFGKLKLSEKDITPLDYIDPEKNEKIESYAERISKPIKADSSEIVLVGHSFGGIISQEIARQKQIDKIFLISSITKRAENPFKFKMISPLKLQGFVTKELILKTFNFWARSQDYSTPELQELFREMVDQNSNQYLAWALKELSIWGNNEDLLNTEIIRIHGTRDKTFPIKLTDGVKYKVENGTHVMVYHQADLISKIIDQELNGD